MASRTHTSANNPAGSEAGEIQEPPSSPSLAFILSAQKGRRERLQPTLSVVVEH